MNEAIRAAHSGPTSSSYIPQDNEEEKVMDAREDGIPEHIFPRDTIWDSKDDGSMTETDCPLARAETVQDQDAWSYYLIINSLIIGIHVYDYEYKQIQDDPLHPYLISLVGIAHSGKDGFANKRKQISQEARREHANMSSQHHVPQSDQGCRESPGGIEGHLRQPWKPA